jgi:hypothetical protein
VTASITTGPPLAPRRFSGAWALVVVAALVGGVLFARSLGSDVPASGAPDVQAHDDAQPEPPATPPTAQPQAQPSVVTAASASASASAAAVALPSPRPRPAPSVAPKTPAPMPPLPAPTQPKSHKGVPFKEL